MEKRNSQRIPLAAEATLNRQGTTLQGKVSDISNGGLGIVLEGDVQDAVRPNQTWSCEVQSEQLPHPIPLRARVVHQEVDGEQDFTKTDLGLQIVYMADEPFDVFCDVLEDEQVK